MNSQLIDKEVLRHWVDDALTANPNAKFQWILDHIYSAHPETIEWLRQYNICIDKNHRGIAFKSQNLPVSVIKYRTLRAMIAGRFGGRKPKSAEKNKTDMSKNGNSTAAATYRTYIEENLETPCDKSCAGLLGISSTRLVNIRNKYKEQGWMVKQRPDGGWTYTPPKPKAESKANIITGITKDELEDLISRAVEKTVEKTINRLLS